MENLSERLDTDGEVTDLRMDEDLDNPDPELAPFRLEEARPLSQALGGFLTAPGVIGDDGNPDLALQLEDNPEVSVWINRLGDSAYILTCWGYRHRTHFEVPRSTVVDVLNQASESPYWVMDICDGELLSGFTDLI